MNKEERVKRLESIKILKRPMYKIGDIVVYKTKWHKENNPGIEVTQSRVIESSALLDLYDNEDDELFWVYYTENTKSKKLDLLMEEEILYKL